MRKLLNGKMVEEFSNAVDLTIHTKAPSKWLLIDLETGQEYMGADVPTKYGRWKRIKDKPMQKMISPCFYCESPAEYTGDVDIVGESFSVVDVCRDHFVFPGIS